MYLQRLSIGRRFSYLLVGVIASWLGLGPAKAGCGINIVCAISESAGRGAGQGMADSLRPLVTDVMEREAPALIAQLKAAVDGNIMTAEQAGERLVDYSTKLFNKAADDMLAKAEERTRRLVAYAHEQTLDLEKQVFADVQKIILSLHCEGLAVQAMIDRQQQVLHENSKNFLDQLLFWRKQKAENPYRAQCRSELGIDAIMMTSDLYAPTTFRLWRCVRLASIDPETHPQQPASAIRDAYNDVVSNGSAAMCALRADTGPLRDVTEIWIEDSYNREAWDKAVHGE